MNLYRVLVLACISFSAFANQELPPKPCAASVWGIASPLNSFDSEHLEFLRWRAERLQREIGHWLSDPTHYNRATAPALGFELEEAFAHSPSTHVYKTRLQSLYRVAEHWVQLIEFMRLFKAPLLETHPPFSSSQLGLLWRFCEKRTSEGRSAQRDPDSDAPVRSQALALVQNVRIPHYFRSFIKMHLEVMDYYQLPHSGVLQALVNELLNTYKDRP